MLALWWYVLVSPLLGGLRLLTELSLRLWPGGGSIAHVAIDPAGDWIVRVPAPVSVARQDNLRQMFNPAGRGDRPVQVRSIQIGLPGKMPLFFTLSFPLFWAIVLAAPWAKSSWRILLYGTGLNAILAVMSLLLFTAYTIATNLHVGPTGFAGVVLDGAEYVNTNVVTYVAPFLIAIWLHAELRAQIFFREAAEAVTPAPAQQQSDKRRGKYRGRR